MSALGEQAVGVLFAYHCEHLAGAFDERFETPGLGFFSSVFIFENAYSKGSRSGEVLVFRRTCAPARTEWRADQRSGRRPNSAALKWHQGICDNTVRLPPQRRRGRV
jgi:hypothetical protein